MDFKCSLFLHFTEVTAHFHQSIFVDAEDKHFFSKDAFQSFDGLLL